jgi:hypothetical protein
MRFSIKNGCRYEVSDILKIKKPSKEGFLRTLIQNRISNGQQVADIFLIGFYRGNSLKAMQFNYNVFTFHDF